MTIMEVCGTHTMNIARAGIKRLLAGKIRLLSGPGCPVCVTPNVFLDRAIALCKKDDVIITTFGDMMKVPGSRSSLYRERADGRAVQIVYSPLDSLEIAEKHPDKKIVFLGVGFETTSPTVAATIKAAHERALKNFYVLCGHKLVPPAMKALVTDPELNIDGFLCPGHVSTIIGSVPYEFIARDHGVPCVIAGFESLDILQGILMLAKQITGKTEICVEIQYTRSVMEQGNPKAMEILNDIFQVGDSSWRGLGEIPQSGLSIREIYSTFDALKSIPVELGESFEHPGCICGEILKGVKIPSECSLFRNVCNPENPVGPCMVSTEGTCAAYYKYES